MRDPVTLPNFSRYRIWDTGVIERKSKDGKWIPMKPNRSRSRSSRWSSYLGLTLCDDNKRRVPVKIHRLVLQAFVGPCPDGMECRHLNGDSVDNRIENLAWGTKKENIADIRRHGRSPDRSGEKSASAKLKESQVLEIRNLYSTGMRSSQIAMKYGVSKQTVIEIANGRSWRNLPVLSHESPCRSPLTNQEKLNAKLLNALGFSQRQIADWLEIDPSCVSVAINDVKRIRQRRKATPCPNLSNPLPLSISGL